VKKTTTEIGILESHRITCLTYKKLF